MYKDKRVERSAVGALLRLLALVGGLWLFSNVVIYVVKHGNEPVLFLGGAGTGGVDEFPNAGPKPNSIHVVLTSNGNSCMCPSSCEAGLRLSFAESLFAAQT